MFMLQKFDKNKKKRLPGYLSIYFRPVSKMFFVNNNLYAFDFVKLISLQQDPNNFCI